MFIFPQLQFPFLQISLYWSTSLLTFSTAIFNMLSNLSSEIFLSDIVFLISRIFIKEPRLESSSITN